MDSRIVILFGGKVPSVFVQKNGEEFCFVSLPENFVVPVHNSYSGQILRGRQCRLNHARKVGSDRVHKVGRHFALIEEFEAVLPQIAWYQVHNVRIRRLRVDHLDEFYPFGLVGPEVSGATAHLWK